AYRRDFWAQQSARVEVWSEKGTVRGVLRPVLDEYGVGFRVMHGFSGATTLYDVAQDDDGRPLIALYVGDFDPSGMWMSERDLPGRLSKYGGDHVSVKRIAITLADTPGLPPFSAIGVRPDERGHQPPRPPPSPATPRRDRRRARTRRPSFSDADRVLPGWRLGRGISRRCEAKLGLGRICG